MLRILNRTSGEGALKPPIILITAAYSAWQDRARHVGCTPQQEEPPVGWRRRRRNLLLTGAALLWGLALGSPGASAQPATAPAVNAPKAGADKEQCAQGQAGDQPNTAPKSGSDGQSDEKSKDEAAPPAYKLLRYEED